MPIETGYTRPEPALDYQEKANQEKQMAAAAARLGVNWDEDRIPDVRDAGALAKIQGRLVGQIQTQTVIMERLARFLERVMGLSPAEYDAQKSLREYEGDIGDIEKSLERGDELLTAILNQVGQVERL